MWSFYNSKSRSLQTNITLLKRQFWKFYMIFKRSSFYTIKFLTSSFEMIILQLLSSDDLWMYAPIAYNGMDIGLNRTPNTRKESWNREDGSVFCSLRSVIFVRNNVCFFSPLITRPLSFFFSFYNHV